MLSGYEYANVGVQWSNYEGRDERAYSFASCLRMMLLDTALYFLLACYLDKVGQRVFQANIFGAMSAPLWAFIFLSSPLATHTVFACSPRAVSTLLPPSCAPSFSTPQVVPSEYGTHEKPWFFLLPSYWRPTPPTTSSPGPSDNVEDGETEADSVEGPPDASIHPRRVAVRGLVKRYADGNVAVKGLQLDMFEGHVTCLLGHNGAGTHFLV